MIGRTFLSVLIAINVIIWQFNVVWAGGHDDASWHRYIQDGGLHGHPFSYSRDALLSLRGNSSVCGLDINLPDECSDTYTNGFKPRKRGRRGGVRCRVRRRKFKPPLPTMLLANVRSLKNKLSELHASASYLYEYRESCLMCFTETWLDKTVDDKALMLPGFHAPIRLDRDLDTTGKKRGDGPFQNAMTCEIYSTFDHVFTGGASWMMAVVAFERYIRLRAPAEHLSTFSVRNIKILAAGLYILQIMISVGPFYGLGEYTVSRGKLSLMVTLNVTTPVDHAPACSVEDMVSLLRRRYTQLMQQRIPDPGFVIAHYLTNVFHVFVARARWVDNGLLFLMRLPNVTVLEPFWEAYEDGSVSQTVNSIVFLPPIVETLGDRISGAISYIDAENYKMLRNGYLPFQELGLCDADFTSVNQHSDIWMAYSLLLTSLLPCAIAVVCTSAALVCHLRGEHDKSEIQEDVYFSRALTLQAWLSIGANLTFTITNILFARGTHFSTITLLGLKYFVNSNSFSLYFIWCIVDQTPFILVRRLTMSGSRLFTKSRNPPRTDTRRRSSKPTSPVSL